MADRAAKHCDYLGLHQIEKIVRFGGPSSRGCCTAVSGIAKFLEDTVFNQEGLLKINNELDRMLQFGNYCTYSRANKLHDYHVVFHQMRISAEFATSHARVVL